MLHLNVNILLNPLTEVIAKQLVNIAGHTSHYHLGGQQSSQQRLQFNIPSTEVGRQY